MRACLGNANGFNTTTLKPCSNKNVTQVQDFCKLLPRRYRNLGLTLKRTFFHNHLKGPLALLIHSWTRLLLTFYQINFYLRSRYRIRTVYNKYTFMVVLHSTKIKSYTVRNKLFQNELQGFFRRCWYLGKKYLPGFWETSRSGKDSFVFPPLCFGALPCTFWCMQPIDSTLSLYIFISLDLCSCVCPVCQSETTV